MTERGVSVIKSEFLFSQITRLSTLYQAWDRVEENHGCAGVDGVTVEKYAAQLEENIGKLQKTLLSAKYYPLPLLRFEIDKPDGGKRPLSVPAVRDRVAQTAAAIILEPIFEKEFEDCSYAYRRGRSHLQAIQKVKQYYEAGFRWVVDIDIDAYFDEVNHELLIARLASLIKDQAVMKLLIVWVRGKIYDGKTIHNLDKGIPQGSPISPLFANLYLDLLDETLLDQGLKVIRFADDFLILCKNEERAQEAYELTEDVLSQLQLKVDTDSEITNFDRGFEYLGATFVRSLVLQKDRETKTKRAPVKLPVPALNLADAIRGIGTKSGTMAAALTEVVSAGAAFLSASPRVGSRNRPHKTEPRAMPATPNHTNIGRQP